MNIVKKITVTQKHINDAKASILFTDEQHCWCPIALALFEQLGVGEYKLIGRSNDVIKKKYISFLNKGQRGGSNLFSVAKTIICNNPAQLPDSDYKSWLHPPMTFNHTKETEKFVRDFDSGVPVSPLSFTIDFKNEK